jgi:hypothetical protein
MAMIEGTLHLDKLPEKGVRLVFSPRTKGTNSRPLGIPTTEQVLSDLKSFWGFTPSKANAAVAQLERDGHVELSVTVDEQAVNKLFL